MVLILSVLVQAIDRSSALNEKTHKCCSYSFVAVIAQALPVPQGPHTIRIYIYEKPLRSSCPLCCYSPLIAPYSPTISCECDSRYSCPKPSQTSQSIVDANPTTRSRSSTTITMLEEEFGACKPHKSGATASSSFYHLSHSGSY